MNKELQELPTIEEIKSVVFSLYDQSCAGLDRFGAAFYKVRWEIIKEDLCEAIKDFFKGATLPLEITNTMIVLIPKKQRGAKLEGLSSHKLM